MPILIKADLNCNFRCDYCYERPIRSENEKIDLDAMKKTIRELYDEGKKREDDRAKRQKRKPNKKHYPKITLHGGEPTILPKPIFEEFLKLSYELSGQSGIQTNGYLIDDDHIEMFKKYNTHVGFSIDGPYSLNRFRGTGSKKDRRKQTEKIMATIDKIMSTERPLQPNEKPRKDKEGNIVLPKLRASVIAVIHKGNALGDNREIMKQWVKALDAKGIHGRLNPCCSGNSDIDLTPEEAADFYPDMFDFMLKNGIRGFSPFKDIKNSLIGEDEVVCVFKNCDPFCTSSATPVLKDGSVGVCLRLYGDGKKYLRGERTNIRSAVLYETDCKGCEWWKHCYGGCTGLSIDWDWRNKDRYCLMYKTMFSKMHNALKALGVKLKKSEKGKATQPERKGDHTDGVVHYDGPWTHEDGYR